MIKKFFALFFFCLTVGYSQSPEKFTYQSIIKNSSSNKWLIVAYPLIDINFSDTLFSKPLTEPSFPACAGTL